MLRNQDRPELLLFVTTNAARWTDGAERPGVARLVAEAADAGTPSLWICADDPKPRRRPEADALAAMRAGAALPSGAPGRARIDRNRAGRFWGRHGRRRRHACGVLRGGVASMASVAILDVTHHPIIPHRHAGPEDAGARAAPGAVRRHRAESRGGDRGAECGHARRWALLGGRGDARWRGAAHESNFKMHPLDGVERNMTH